MNETLEIILKMLLVAFLVFLNGFFVAAEFAIVKIRATQLQPLLVKGHRRAKIAQRIVGNLDAALSATQLGITLASLGLGWFGEPAFAKLLEPAMTWLNIPRRNSSTPSRLSSLFRSSHFYTLSLVNSHPSRWRFSVLCR